MCFNLYKLDVLDQVYLAQAKLCSMQMNELPNAVYISGVRNEVIAEIIKILEDIRNNNDPDAGNGAVFDNGVVIVALDITTLAMNAPTAIMGPRHLKI